MLNKLARILLTLTALAPVGLTYAWAAFTEEQRPKALIILAVTAVLWLVCWGMLVLAPKKLPASEFKAKSIEAADQENTAFLLLYVMPLFTAKFDTLDWQIWVPTLAIFAVITATGYNYHFNPLLGIIGWHFYKVESAEGVKYVLITKKQLRTAANSIRVGQLTEYILLDLGGN